MPKSKLTVLKHSPKDLQIMVDFLAAFASFPQDQNCSSLLTKTLTKELCTDCKHLSAELALTLAFCYLLVLTHFMFCSMPRSPHSPEVVVQSALCLCAR